jgi:hypothetical protein
MIMLTVNILLFIAILFITIVIIFLLNYFIFLYKIKHMDIVHEKEKFHLDKIKHNEYEEEKQKILKTKNHEVNEAYDIGFKEGFKRAEMNSKIISLQIRPWENEVSNKGFLKKTIHYQIGYQYILMVNGIPALTPHQIAERNIKLSEANEENIKQIISQVKDTVDKAIKLTGGLASFVGDFQAIQDNLIKRLHRKK